MPEENGLHREPPSMLARTEEIQRQIQELSGRDLQLWSIIILIVVLLTGGLLAVLLPNVVWSRHSLQIEISYLPQVFFGLVSLVLLFNIYLLGQKFTLNSTRRALIRELVLNERLESLSLIDPLTQLLNRRAMNELIPPAVARTNRLGTCLTFSTFDIDGFREINKKFGVSEGDLLLVEFAKMLKMIYRGGDVVFRQGGDEFLVLMPDTSEEQAEFPLERLKQLTEQWNLNSKKGYELSFNWGVAAYAIGSDYADVLRSVERKAYQRKHNLVPVF